MEKEDLINVIRDSESLDSEIVDELEQKLNSNPQVINKKVDNGGLQVELLNTTDWRKRAQIQAKIISSKFENGEY